MTETRFITPDHPLHAGELDLRFRLLRAPLGMERGTEWFEHERDCLHLVAVRRGAVVGCVMFHPDGRGGGRLLQMAVDEPLQGTGLGRRLVHVLERELRQRGVRRVVLHARDLAVGFYEKLGYAPFGEPYEEVGIPHISMQRQL